MSRDGVVVPLGRQRRVGREVKSRGVPDNGACGNGGNGDGGGVTSLGCSGGGGVGECTGHITQHFLRARRQNPRRREEERRATPRRPSPLPGAKPPAPPPRCSKSQFQRQQQHQKRIKLFRVKEEKENTTVRRVVRRVAAPVAADAVRARPAPLPPVDLKRNCSSRSLSFPLSFASAEAN